MSDRTISVGYHHGYEVGDSISMPRLNPYPWPVRLAAWLCRFRLPLVEDEFVVTAVQDNTSYDIQPALYTLDNP